MIHERSDGQEQQDATKSGNGQHKADPGRRHAVIFQVDGEEVVYVQTEAEFPEENGIEQSQQVAGQAKREQVCEASHVAVGIRNRSERRTLCQDSILQGKCRWGSGNSDQSARKIVILFAIGLKAKGDLNARHAKSGRA